MLPNAKPCMDLYHIHKLIDTRIEVLRHENPTKASYIPSAAYTLVEIIHRQCDPAIIAQTQAATGPNDDTSRRALADHTLRTTFAHS